MLSILTTSALRKFGIQCWNNEAFLNFNPVRANVAAGVSKSHYTSAKVCDKAILKAPKKSNEPLLP